MDACGGKPGESLHGDQYGVAPVLCAPWLWWGRWLKLRTVFVLEQIQISSQARGYHVQHEWQIVSIAPERPFHVRDGCN